MKLLHYIASACVLVIPAFAHTAEKPNTLFIAIDDLRPELGCFGSKVAATPNLDRLAADGLLFMPSNVTDQVMAFDLNTGASIWRFFTDGPVRFAPVYHSGKENSRQFLRIED
jgi:hypothetical protein